MQQLSGCPHPRLRHILVGNWGVIVYSEAMKNKKIKSFPHSSF